MTRHTPVLVLVLAAAVAGCAGRAVPSRPVFYKPGATVAQIEADEARCVLQAIGGETRFMPVLSLDREAVYQCMQAQGYAVRRGTAQASPRTGR